MMHWQDSITEEEMAVIEELRKNTIHDCTPKMLEDDSLFYRFCKARDFNLKKAEEMLRKHITWREEYQMDTIATDYKTPEVLEKYLSVSELGDDKDGHVVFYLDFGGIDIVGALKSAKLIDFEKFGLQMNERSQARMRKHKNHIETNCMSFIFNFDGLTFAKATNKQAIKLLIIGLKMFQDNYPEKTKHAYFINASFYFTLLYSVVKQFIAPNLEEKIQVFGTEGYKELLLKQIDENVLPAFLGGKRTDPDGNPNCYTILKWGKEVPEKYYFRKSEKRLSTLAGVTKLTVTRFAKSDIRFEVEEPDSLLEWEFETKSRDIGFGVYFKDRNTEDSKPVALVPKQRIDTCMEPETGVYKCKNAGTYIIVFDNSYSWFYPKDIFYRTRIISPNDEENSPWT